MLVKCVTKSWPTYAHRPIEGADLAKNQNCTVFVVRDAKFEREYLCTGSICAADILQFKTPVYALVKSITTSWPAYTRRPTEGANLAKNSHVRGI